MDWFTFGAQIVNFLVLVGLLRWLLYDRIIQAMNEREQKIANRLQEAEQQREQARDRQQRYERKADELDRRRDELLDEAREQAERERQQLRDEARQEIDDQRERWREAFRREREDLLGFVRQQAGQVSVKAARRALGELADQELESRMLRSFASRLEGLDAEQREEISHHLGNGESQVQVRSTFEVPEDARERLRSAIQKNLRYDGPIEFEQASELICGLELEVGGYTFGWSARDFLGELEHEFERRMKSFD